MSSITDKLLKHRKMSSASAAALISNKIGNAAYSTTNCQSW